MDDNLFSTDEEMDDDAFLKSLDALLEEPAEPEPPKEPEPEQAVPERKPKKGLPLPVLLGAVAGVLVCIGLIIGIPKALDHFGGPLAEDTTIGPIDLGGLTKAEAKKALKEQYLLLQEELCITLPRKNAQNADLSPYPLELTKETVGLKLDTGKAVKDAYALGKQPGSHSLELLPYLTLDTDAIHTAVTAYCKDLEGLYRDPSWTLTGQAPDVTAEGFGENSTCQTVELDPGMPGVTLDQDALYDLILDCYAQDTTSAEYTGSIQFTVPKTADLGAIYEETKLDPEEPSIDRDTLKLTKGVPGYGIDLEEAQADLKKAAYGKTLSIQIGRASCRERV